MRFISFVWGLLAMAGFLFGLIPCLGAWNWINIPFAVIGLIISIVAVTTSSPRHKGPAIAGLIFCTIAVAVGALRLLLGFGIF
jgi:hypothetical protein